MVGPDAARIIAAVTHVEAFRNLTVVEPPTETMGEDTPMTGLVENPASHTTEPPAPKPAGVSFLDALPESLVEREQLPTDLAHGVSVSRAASAAARRAA